MKREYSFKRQLKMLKDILREISFLNSIYVNYTEGDFVIRYLIQVYEKVIKGNKVHVIFSNDSDFKQLLFLPENVLIYDFKKILSKEDFKEEVEESVEADTGSFGASSVDVHSSLLLSILIAGFTVMYMSAIVSGDFAYVYFRETLVLSRSETALILAITGFIGVIASFAVSWFSDRYSENNALILVFGISIIAPILLLFNTLATVCISLILIGVAVKSFNPLSRKYATHFLKAATVIGLLNATGNIGRAIGQLVLGYAYDVIDAQTISLSVFRILELPLLLTLPLPALLWSATILYRRKLT